MKMSYIIKHAKTGQVFNIKEYGLDRFNIGINPKVYSSKEHAQEDIDKLEHLRKHQLQVCANTKQGLQDHGRPSWYFNRHEKKLTEKQKIKLEWYESCYKSAEDKRKFTERLTIEDFVIEEYK